MDALVFELFKPGNTPVKYWGAKSLIDGRWHHVAFLRDGTNGKVRLYLDGQVEIEQTSVSFSDIDTLNADINIGWFNNGYGFHFTGSVDELAIYEKLLSEQEIKSHHFLARELSYSMRDSHQNNAVGRFNHTRNLLRNS